MELLTPWRIKTYTRAVALALLVGFLALVALSFQTRITPQGEPLGADYVVFYGVGALVLEGNIAGLFDVATIQGAQAAAVGYESLPAYHAWVYPPFVAALYAPFAALPYVPAFLAYVCFMLGCCWIASGHLARLVPELGPWRETVFLVTATFYPVLRATTGGQNTALSLMMLTGAALAYKQGRHRALGLWAGALLFKPHFGLFVLGFCFLAGRFRAVAIGGVVALAWWFFGGLVAGPDWVSLWWGSVAAYRDLEANTNGGLLVSFLGVAERLFGAGNPLAWGMGAMASVMLLAYAVLQIRRVQPQQLWALIALVLVLCSPHTQFYDVGLLALTGAVLVGSAPVVVALLWAATWVHAAFPDPLVQPLFFLVLAANLYLQWTLHAASGTHRDKA